MYKPTIRYDDRYRKYVSELFKVSKLDRNQIIRLALFAAPFNKLLLAQLEEHLNKSSSLPSPTGMYGTMDYGWIRPLKRRKRRKTSAMYRLRDAKGRFLPENYYQELEEKSESETKVR